MISRIAASNRRFYSLGQAFRSRTVSKALKIKIHKTIMKPLMVFGSETWLWLRWIRKDRVHKRGKY